MYNVFTRAGEDTVGRGEQAGVEGGKGLKSISETQPEFQLLQVNNITVIEATPEDELLRISRKCAVVLIVRD